MAPFVIQQEHAGKNCYRYVLIGAVTREAGPLTHALLNMQTEAYFSTIIPAAAQLQNKNLRNSGSTREAVINHDISVPISANEI